MILSAVLDGRHFLTLWAVVAVTITAWHCYRSRL